MTDYFLFKTVEQLTSELEKKEAIIQKLSITLEDTKQKLKEKEIEITKMSEEIKTLVDTVFSYIIALKTNRNGPEGLHIILRTTVIYANTSFISPDKDGRHRLYKSSTVFLNFVCINVATNLYLAH